MAVEELVVKQIDTVSIDDSRVQNDLVRATLNTVQNQINDVSNAFNSELSQIINEIQNKEESEKTKLHIAMERRGQETFNLDNEESPFYEEKVKLLDNIKDQENQLEDNLKKRKEDSEPQIEEQAKIAAKEAYARVYNEQINALNQQLDEELQDERAKTLEKIDQEKIRSLNALNKQLSEKSAAYYTKLPDLIDQTYITNEDVQEFLVSRKRKYEDKRTRAIKKITTIIEKSKINLQDNASSIELAQQALIQDREDLKKQKRQAEILEQKGTPTDTVKENTGKDSEKGDLDAFVSQMQKQKEREDILKKTLFEKNEENSDNNAISKEDMQELISQINKQSTDISKEIPKSKPWYKTFLPVAMTGIVLGGGIYHMETQQQKKDAARESSLDNKMSSISRSESKASVSAEESKKKSEKNTDKKEQNNPQGSKDDSDTNVSTIENSGSEAISTGLKPGNDYYDENGKNIGTVQSVTSDGHYIILSPEGQFFTRSIN